jgi:hypothetical protein
MSRSVGPRGKGCQCPLYRIPGPQDTCERCAEQKTLLPPAEMYTHVSIRYTVPCTRVERLHDRRNRKDLGKIGRGLIEVISRYCPKVSSWKGEYPVRLMAGLLAVLNDMFRGLRQQHG